MVLAAPALVAVQPAVLVIAGVVVLRVAELLEVLQESEVGGIVVPQLSYVLPANVEPVVLGAGQEESAVEDGSFKEGILLEASAVEAGGIAEIGIVKVDWAIELR